MLCVAAFFVLAVPLDGLWLCSVYRYLDPIVVKCGKLAGVGCLLHDLEGKCVCEFV